MPSCNLNVLDSRFYSDSATSAANVSLSIRTDPNNHYAASKRYPCKY